MSRKPTIYSSANAWPSRSKLRSVAFPPTSDDDGNHRHRIEGVPKTITVSDEIREALAETVNVIVDAVRAPSGRRRSCRHIVDRGIVPTGGGSSQKPDKRSEETGLRWPGPRSAVVGVRAPARCCRTSTSYGKSRQMATKTRTHEEDRFSFSCLRVFVVAI